MRAVHVQGALLPSTAITLQDYELTLANYSALEVAACMMFMKCAL